MHMYGMYRKMEVEEARFLVKFLRKVDKDCNLYYNQYNNKFVYLSEEDLNYVKPNDDLYTFKDNREWFQLVLNSEELMKFNIEHESLKTDINTRKLIFMEMINKKAVLLENVATSYPHLFNHYILNQRFNLTIKIVDMSNKRFKNVYVDKNIKGNSVLSLYEQLEKEKGKKFKYFITILH